MSSIVVKRRAMRRRQEVRAPRFPWLLTIVLALGAVSALAIAGSLAAAWATYNHFSDGYVPPDEFFDLHFVGLTEIYDRTGAVELGTLSNPNAQLSDPVPLDDISQYMIDATVATEDNTFWDNPGFNMRGLTRAFVENIEDYLRGDDLSGTGGSSITQQLVKTLYLSTDCVFVNGVKSCTAPRTVERKLQEIAYAVQLEQDVPKEEILALYLNSISYADRYLGVEAAAQGYFRKSAADLTLGEAALLAGIPAAPTAFHPRLNCSTDENGNCRLDELGRYFVSGPARERQHEVLELMLRNGYISADDAQAAMDDVVRVYPGVSDLEAPAWIDNQVEPALVRMCEAGLLERLVIGDEPLPCSESVASAGYRVTTALDWELTQAASQLAREEIAAGIESGCNCFNTSIVTIDPRSGQILVYLPNVNPENTADVRVRGDIDQANEINQPGSSFKPAVYMAWFDYLNKAPMSTFWDTSPLAIGGATITNPRGGAGSEGLISARAGLGGSQNVPAFRAAAEAGPDNVIAMAGKLGITTLYQNFDPTWVAHEDVNYGASIATGGANIKVVDMAYMDTVFANMGVMVGVPHLARELDLSTLESLWSAEGTAYDRGIQQKLDFQRGYTRLPGTRNLDPVVVLEVRDSEGNLLYKHAQTEAEAEELRAQGISTLVLVREQVVDAGSAWLLASIMTDCTARFIIWGCGGSNTDNSLDFFVADDSGVRVPAGVKTGTQQGFLSAVDTLEVWVTGYSRYSGTAIWVGNADNSLVVDGPSGAFAAAHTVLWLYKQWQGEYHAILRTRGEFDSPADFSTLQPGNVAFGGFETPATDRGLGGGCNQSVSGWYRTDVTYESVCESATVDARNGLLASAETPPQFRVEREFVMLPDFGVEEARNLARRMGIPIKPSRESSGQVPVAILSPSNGRTISSPTDVIGTADTGEVESWTLEIGPGSNPSEWLVLGSGEGSIANQVLGTIPADELDPGVYTLRLTAEDAEVTFGLEDRVVINIGPGGDDDDGDGGDGGDGDDGGEPGSPQSTPTPRGSGSGAEPTPTPKVPATPIPTPTPVPGREPDEGDGTFSGGQDPNTR